MARDEEPILEEALDNLREATQRVRAIQAAMRASGLDGDPRFRDLTFRVANALAAAEAAGLEARRQRDLLRRGPDR